MARRAYNTGTLSEPTRLMTGPSADCSSCPSRPHLYRLPPSSQRVDRPLAGQGGEGRPERPVL